MKAITAWWVEWKWPTMILCVLAVMIWIDDKDERERRTFETQVMLQHKETLAAQRDLEASLQRYTDIKTVDRWHGRDAAEQESRLMHEINALHSELETHIVQEQDRQ